MSASDQNTLMQRIVAELSALGKRIDDAFANIRASRELLVAARVYYVRTDGNDSNNGLANTSGGAFLTVQKAVDVIATLDIGGNAVTIQVGDGTYTGDVTLKNVSGYATVGNLVIQGNVSTPSNVVISTTSATCFTATSLSSIWIIQNMKLQTATSGFCILSNSGSTIYIANIVFGTCAYYHILVQNRSMVIVSGNYTISGNAIYHWASLYNSLVYVSGSTITITGTPAFTNFAFAKASIINCPSITFVGGATGSRYSASGNAVIDTGGGSSTYLPGNAGGTTATGGQYI